jgi:hypothetical protein
MPHCLLSAYSPSILVVFYIQSPDGIVYPSWRAAPADT